MSRTRSDATRRRILNATLSLAEGRDFAQVTTREIAKEAGVAEATLFRYFPRKDAIMEGLIEELAEDFFARFAGVLEVISSPVERLRALSRIQSGFGFEHRAAVRVFEREVTFDRPMSQALKDQKRRYMDAVEGIMAAGLEVGQLREGIDVRAAALAFHASCRAVLEEEWLYEEELADAAAFTARADEYLDLLLTGLLAPREAS